MINKKSLLILFTALVVSTTLSFPIIVSSSTSPEPQTVEAIDCESGLWVVLNEVGNPLPAPLIRSIKKYNPLEIQAQSMGKARVMSVCFKPYIKVTKSYVEFSLTPPSTTTTTSGSATTTTSSVAGSTTTTAGSTTTTTFVDPVVIPYGGTRISPKSSLYKVKVNGEEIFVHNHQASKNHFTHFAFTGNVEIEVEYASNINKLLISPRSLNVNPEVTGKKFSFSINEPKKFIIAINKDLQRQAWTNSNLLFIFADPLEENPPKIGDPGVLNVADYSSPQAAINACPKDGTVYFPPGNYNGQVVAKNNMVIYLAPGAVISNGGGEVIKISNKENVVVKGRGVVKAANGHILRPEKSKHVTIKDIILLRTTPDHGYWGFLIAQLDDSVIDNTKIINPAKDGMDIVSCQNLEVKNVFVYSLDDNIVIKCMDRSYWGLSPRPVFNITVRDSLVYSMYRTCGPKIGTESDHDYGFQDITFKNIDVANSVTLWYSRGKPMKNVKLEDVSVENSYYAFFAMGDLWSACANNGDSPCTWGGYNQRGPVDMTVNNMKVYQIWPEATKYHGLLLIGSSGAEQKVTFNNLWVKDRYIRSLQDLTDLGLEYQVQHVDVEFNVDE